MTYIDVWCILFMGNVSDQKFDVITGVLSKATTDLGEKIEESKEELKKELGEKIEESKKDLGEKIEKSKKELKDELGEKIETEIEKSKKELKDELGEKIETEIEKSKKELKDELGEKIETEIEKSKNSVNNNIKELKNKIAETGDIQSNANNGPESHSHETEACIKILNIINQSDIAGSNLEHVIRETFKQITDKEVDDMVRLVNAAIKQKNKAEEINA